MPVAGADSTSKLFVGGLASTTDEDSLRQFFEQWGGHIIDVVVMRDPTTKRSRGFGFVTFENDSQVDVAMTNRPHVINGKDVDSKRAVPREFQNKTEAQVSSKRIYLSGIKPEHTEEMLKEHFSTYGLVNDVDIVIDKKTGQRRGFAFITFNDYDPADKAVLAKNHMICGKRCDCRKALTKEEMAKVQQQEVDRQARSQRSRGSNGYDYSTQNNGSGYYDGYGSRTAAQPPVWSAGPPGPPNPAVGGYPSPYDYGNAPAYPPSNQYGMPPQQPMSSQVRQGQWPAQSAYSAAPQTWNNPPAPSYGDYSGQPIPYGYPAAGPPQGRSYPDPGYDTGAYGGLNKGQPQQQSWRGDSWGPPPRAY